MRRDRSLVTSFVCLASLLATSALAGAQSVASPDGHSSPSIARVVSFDQPRRPVPPRRTPFTIGVRASFEPGADQLLASHTFRALFGTPRLVTFGANADVVLDRRFFVRIGVQRASENGTRVFVDEGTVFSTGVPLHLVLQPVEIGGGVRLVSRVRPHRIVPYLGAAFVVERFAESSPGDASAEDLPEWFHGAAFFAGADLSIAGRLSVGGEFEFRTLPNAIGTSDVSQAFGESNLGSFGIRITVAYHFGRS